MTDIIPHPIILVTSVWSQPRQPLETNQKTAIPFFELHLKRLHLSFSCPQYTPKPGSPGKVYWLSGPPGAGKSTTCQLLARKKDFVYFEADATMNLINPFTDINVENPSIATFQGKALKVIPSTLIHAGSQFALPEAVLLMYSYYISSGLP